jgi:uncharacterized protein YceK
MMMVRFLIALVVAVHLSGCGTYVSLEHRNNYDPVVFGGMRMDINYIKVGAESNEWLKQQELHNPYLDLPLSAISDLVLLPYLVWYAITH